LYKDSLPRKIFLVFNYLFLTLLTLSIVIPILNVVVTSLAEDKDVLENSFLLIPKSITFEHYKAILNSGYLQGFLNSLKITIIGFIIAMPLTIITAYALSHDDLKGKNVYMKLIVATMIVDGGIIPLYLLIRYLGLMGTHAAVYLPLAMYTYNLILMVNYMRSIPKSLAESARIDGASELVILFKIIVPVSTPIIAAISLFYVVLIWNNYFYPLMFINDPNKMNIQVMLRSLIIENNSGNADSFGRYDNFKMAVMIMGILPVAILYPFIQKHFISGIMLGIVCAVQTFGDFLNFNPHLHIIAIDGCFNENNDFMVGLSPKAED